MMKALIAAGLLAALAGLRLEARWLILSAGGGRVLRMTAGLYTYF
ncbi:MAG: hypothetical protein WCB96_07260 [Candidatus Aminicenantales bacterium]